jgi:hypothetical protein
VLLNVPDGVYSPTARVVTWRPARTDRGFRVAVVSAGMSDGPVADEVVAVASAIGLEVIDVRDVGVAAIHRLLDMLPVIETADVAVAGMEGALASVLGGLVTPPVVAVPTSTGYGAALDGLNALLAMDARTAEREKVEERALAVAEDLMTQILASHRRRRMLLVVNGVPFLLTKIR